MTYTVVQSVTGSAGPSLTLTLTLAATTAGNDLIIRIGAYNATAAIAVSGVTLGGSSTGLAKAAGATGGTGKVDAEIWTAENIAGGQTALVITVAGGTATNTSIIATVDEVSGLATSAAVDQTHAAGGSNSPWSSGATGTTAQAAELVYGMFAGLSLHVLATVTGPAPPWSNQVQRSVSVAGFEGGFFLTGSQTSSATGTFTYSGTHDDSTAMSWAAAAITLTGPSSSSGTATLAASSSLAAPAVQRSPATLAATGTVTAAGGPRGTASLAAAASLAARATLKPAAELDASGTLAGTGVSFSGEIAELGAVGTLAAAPSTGSAAALAGSGTLAAQVTAQPVAALTAASSLAAAGHAQGTAVLAAHGTLAGAGVSTNVATLAATGALAAHLTVRAKATLAATAAIAANEGQPGIVTLAGTGTLAAHGQAYTPAALTAVASLAATGTVITHYRRRWANAPGYLRRSGGTMG